MIDLSEEEQETERANAGILAAIENAGRVWELNARMILKDYLSRSDEIVIKNVWREGLTEPPEGSKRSIGAVTKYAQKMNWMEKIPYPNREGWFATTATNTLLWRSNICNTDITYDDIDNAGWLDF